MELSKMNMWLIQCHSRAWQISKESYVINTSLPKFICIKLRYSGNSCSMEFTSKFCQCRFRCALKQQPEVLLLQIPKLDRLTLEVAIDFLYPRQFHIDLEATQLPTPGRGNEFEQCSWLFFYTSFSLFVKGNDLRSAK